MSENVVKFYPSNAADSADAVLEQAQGAYKDVLLLGYDDLGEVDIRSTSGLTDGGDILWLIEGFKAKLIAGDYAGNADES